MNSHGKSLVAFAVAVAIGVSACGSSGSTAKSGSSKPADISPAGDIPDTQAFVAYAPPTGGYQLKVPEGWARADQSTGAEFTDKLNAIRVESHTGANPVTPASIRAEVVPSLRGSSSAFHLVSVVTVKRTAGDAIVVRYRNQSPPDAVTGKRIAQDVEVYEFWKTGVLVTITLSSPHGADNVDPWRIVTNSFGWS